jgi:hypothetical protein
VLNATDDCRTALVDDLSGTLSGGKTAEGGRSGRLLNWDDGLGVVVLGVGVSTARGSSTEVDRSSGTCHKERIMHKLNIIKLQTLKEEK